MARIAEGVTLGQMWHALDVDEKAMREGPGSVLFGDTPAVSAFLDRLMHYGHFLEIRGRSYRLNKSSLSRANRKAVSAP